MGTDLNIGHVTAYAYAKSKGYTGTEEQFATELAQFAQNAQQVAEDRAAVEQLVDEFLNTTAPAVIQDVVDEGTSQVGRVAGAGTAQVTRVGEAGNTQIDAVGAAGTTQIGLVTAEGTTQVTRVQDKGDEVIDSIPADYTALTQEVSDLNQQISDVKSAIIYLADTGELDYFYAASISGTKLKQIALDIPAGTYQLRISNIQSTDTDAETCKVLFYNASNVIVLDKTYSRGVAIDDTVTIATPATYGFVYASDTANHATGDTFEFTNFRVCTIRLETALEPVPVLRKRSLTVQDFDNLDAFLNASGNRVANPLYETTQPFPVSAGDQIKYHLFHNSNALPIIALYSKANDTTAVDKVYVDANATYKTGTYTVPSNGFIRFCFAKAGADSYAYFYDEIADNIKVYIRNHGVYEKLNGKNVCILGDSIAFGTGATTSATDSWAAIFAEITGCNLTNLAVGGSSLQYRAAAEQESKSVYTVSTETDFSPYDICIVAAGTNDILGSAGTPESTGNDNACGALKLIIQNIMTSNPLIQVVYFTPFFRARGSAGDGKNSDDNAYNGIYLYELADNLETVSKANHVPCKNMYRDFLCNKYNAASILADGLHPNNIGHARLANVYADFVEANI